MVNMDDPIHPFPKNDHFFVSDLDSEALVNNLDKKRQADASVQQAVQENNSFHWHVFVKKRRNRIFLSTLLLHCVMFFDSTLMAPHITDIANDLNINKNDRDFKIGGVLKSCQFSVGLFVTFFICKPVKYADRSVVMLVLGMITCIVQVLLAYVTDFAQLLAARCILGLTLTSLDVFVFFAHEIFEESDQETFLEVVGISFGVSLCLGKFVAVVVGNNFGWRYTFVDSGVLIFICNVYNAVNILLYYRHQAHENDDQEHLVASKRQGAAMDMRPLDLGPPVIMPRKKKESEFMQLLREPLNVYLLCNELFVSIPSAVLGFFLNDFLCQDAGAPSKYAALIIELCVGIGNVLGLLLSKKIVGINTFSAFINLKQWLVLVGFLHVISFFLLVIIFHVKFSYIMMFPAFLGSFFVGANTCIIRSITTNKNSKKKHMHIFSTLNTFDSIGKGPGLLLITALVATLKRKAAFSLALVGYLLSAISSMVCCWVLDTE